MNGDSKTALLLELIFQTFAVSYYFIQRLVQCATKTHTKKKKNWFMSTTEWEADEGRTRKDVGSQVVTDKERKMMEL